MDVPTEERDFTESSSLYIVSNESCLICESASKSVLDTSGINSETWSSTEKNSCDADIAF